MFDELIKYKNQGHFFFQKGDSMVKQSKNVPNLPGVYYIFRLARGRVELVFIEKSGTLLQDGDFNNHLLKTSLNSNRGGMGSQAFFEQKIQDEGIDALDIYWFVTFDDHHGDLPAYVEGIIMQRYFDIHGCLPPWNKEF